MRDCNNSGASANGISSPLRVWPSKLSRLSTLWYSPNQKVKSPSKLLQKNLIKKPIISDKANNKPVVKETVKTKLSFKTNANIAITGAKEIRLSSFTPKVWDKISIR